MNEPNRSNSGTLDTDANRDPITGALGAHPVGTGIGAIGTGAVAGAVGGAIAGPIGAAAGAVVGAVVGGLGGKAAAEAVNPTTEIKHWRENFSHRPYADPNLGYEEYGPAYRYGWESFGRHGVQGKTFDGIEADLAQGWDHAKGASGLAWDTAKLATRDAWDRVETAARRSGTPATH